jgi:3-carboxy-cis,cis-muconate cycloisomerase
VEGLEVDVERMRANLDLTNGLVVSEAVMMVLATYLGREYADDLVYGIRRVALIKNRPLPDLPCENAEIAQHFDRAELTKLCDPANYLGLARVMVDRVLARVAPQVRTRFPAVGRASPYQGQERRFNFFGPGDRIRPTADKTNYPKRT